LCFVFWIQNSKGYFWRQSLHNSTD